MRDIQSLSLREQVQVARYVQRLSATARRKRATVLRETQGSVDDADGRAFEEALVESRKMEPHGRARQRNTAGHQCRGRASNGSTPKLSAGDFSPRHPGGADASASFFV